MMAVVVVVVGVGWVWVPCLSSWLDMEKAGLGVRSKCREY